MEIVPYHKALPIWLPISGVKDCEVVIMGGETFLRLHVNEEATETLEQTILVYSFKDKKTYTMKASEPVYPTNSILTYEVIYHDTKKACHADQTQPS